MHRWRNACHADNGSAWGTFTHRLRTRGRRLCGRARGWIFRGAAGPTDIRA